MSGAGVRSATKPCERLGAGVFCALFCASLPPQPISSAMSTDNLAALTASHRAVAAKRRARRQQVAEVVFDDDARR
jgi:hypothetical protein